MEHGKKKAHGVVGYGNTRIRKGRKEQREQARGLLMVAVKGKAWGELTEEELWFLWESIQCTQEEYIKRLQEAYSPQQNKQYRRCAKSEKEIKVKDEREYEKIPSRALVRGKKEWSLSVGRVLPKDKDISRSRPIVPFTKHLGRSLGRIIGAALTAVIKEMDKYWNTMNLSTPQEFTHKMWEANNSKFWRKRWSGRFTMAKMDIKNLFTNMDKEEGYKSVCEALKELEKRDKHTIRISKDRSMKRRDGVQEGGNGYRLVTTEDIRQYVRFELDNCYIVVLGKIYKQVDGLPMGGMISACVAQLDAMRKENENLEVWKKAKFPGMWHRYRDDTFLLIPSYKPKQWVEDVATRLERMYGAGLTVEVEDIQHKEINMLEKKVIVTKEGIITRDNNKNIDWRKKDWLDVRKWKVRYPTLGSNIDNKTFINTIIGAQTATKRRTNSEQGYVEDTMKNVIEWHMRGYKHQWMHTAICRVDQGMIDFVLPLLAMLRHGQEEGGRGSGERIESRPIKCLGQNSGQ
jgi:hypothetical protein